MLFTITQKCYVSMSEEEKQISIRNNFANNDQSLFARAGFFDIRASLNIRRAEAREKIFRHDDRRLWRQRFRARSKSYAKEFYEI